MSGETQGFRVKADDLLSVARAVQALADDISGTNGNVTGNVTEFQTGASKGHLVSALKSVFESINENSAYVEAYGWEEKGLNEKYTAITQQLQRLSTACRTTAEQYGAQDEYTQQAVNQVGPGPGPGNGPGQTSGEMT